ncbi:MAG: class I SAM-dependent methyltransferase [Burkholderia gladioli]
MDAATAVVLRRLHERSTEEVMARARAQFQGDDDAFAALGERYFSLAPRLRGQFLASHGLSSEDAQSSQGTALSLAVTPDTGRFLRQMVLMQRPARVLELGSSRGVSTLYLADGLRTLGRGSVVATERDPDKCASLRAHVSAAALEAYVDLREGDVFDTVAQLSGPFDLVFVDVWADAYLPLFRAIERLLRPGSMVVTDNMYTANEAVDRYRHYLGAHPRLSSMTLDCEFGLELTAVLAPLV